MARASLVQPSTDSQLVMEDIMKYLRQICLGFFLLLALSIPAFAGDVQAPARTCVAGEIGCPGATVPQESPGITGEILTPGLLSLVLAAIF